MSIGLIRIYINVILIGEQVDEMKNGASWPSHLAFSFATATGGG